MLLDPLKFTVRYALSGKAWGLAFDKKVSETKPALMSWINYFVMYICVQNWMLILIYVVWFAMVFLQLIYFPKRRSPPKRTLVRELVKLHGQLSNVHFMAFSQWRSRCSLNAILSGTLTSWLMKQEDVQRLQGCSLSWNSTANFCTIVHYTVRTTELMGKKKNHELAKTKTSCFSVTLTVAFFVNVFHVLIPFTIFFTALQTKGASYSKRQSEVVCKTKGIRYWCCWGPFWLKKKRANGKKKPNNITKGEKRTNSKIRKTIRPKW